MRSLRQIKDLINNMAKKKDINARIPIKIDITTGMGQNPRPPVP